jgi:hypothetical protein
MVNTTFVNFNYYALCVIVIITDGIAGPYVGDGSVDKKVFAFDAVHLIS